MKTICFDFDGVICKFNGWRGVDIFGAPNFDVIRAMNRLRGMGYHLIIWTTRAVTPALVGYLNRNSVPYCSINSNAHNPDGAGAKPIYHVMIDDRAIGYRGQSATTLIASIEALIKNSAEIIPGENKTN